MTPGGAEVLLANSLSSGGLSEHTENHLAFFMGPSYLLDRLDNKVTIHNLNYKGVTDVWQLLQRIKKIIVDYNIDIVHSHLNPAGLYAHLAMPKGVKHIHTLHTTYSMDKETTKTRLWLEKHLFLLKKSTNVILLSDFIKADFINAIPFKGKAFVLNNFVPDHFFELKTNDYNYHKKELKLIALGTLKPLKNFEYLIQVFQHLKAENISLDIYGAGNKAVYEQTIAKLGVKVNMMGHIKNTAAVICNYDLFIMPSKFEGFPLSVFEAMAAGLPAMLSDIKPLKSIVNEHAIYFSLNDEHQVAAILKDIYNGKININEQSRNAKKYALATVTRAQYIHNLLSIYESI